MSAIFFPSRLKFLRRANKISQQDLSDRLSVARTTYSSWESGKAEPDIEMLINLSNFFDVSTDFLLGIDQKRENPSLDALRSELWELITIADDSIIRSILQIIKRIK